MIPCKQKTFDVMSFFFFDREIKDFFFIIFLFDVMS